MITQYRWYDEQLDIWEEWKDCDVEKAEFIRYCISNGSKCQIRTLYITDMEGWGVNE